VIMQGTLCRFGDTERSGNPIPCLDAVNKRHVLLKHGAFSGVMTAQSSMSGVLCILVGSNPLRTAMHKGSDLSK
jgi:hypothetical protein